MSDSATRDTAATRCGICGGDHDAYSALCPPDTAPTGDQDRITDSAAPSEEEIAERFKAIWRYCMIDHEVGTLPGGPCQECVTKYAVSGPPDGKWNR